MGWEDRVWEITTEDLLKKYTSGKRNFAGAVVIREKGVGRLGIDLEGAILRDINLRGADLSYADLRKADLTGADLFGACFTEACLENAIIREANLEGVNLTYCNLRGADLTGSYLVNAYAFCANFRGAIMTPPEGCIFKEADFTGITPPYYDMIDRALNFLFRTTMPDGTFIEGPELGEWKPITK
jgi:uncharacterized protein YjbI with pentapeptide repeats